MIGCSEPVLLSGSCTVQRSEPLGENAMTWLSNVVQNTSPAESATSRETPDVRSDDRVVDQMTPPVGVRACTVWEKAV
jgi:hypothetical protein